MVMHRSVVSRAFTLIEIMIVIAIIAILAGIMMPNMMRARGEANLSSCMENTKTIATALSMALIRYESSFKSEFSLMTDSATLAPATGPVEKLVTLKYLKSAPKCPATSGDYTIGYNCAKFKPGDSAIWKSWIVLCGSGVDAKTHEFKKQTYQPRYALGVGGDAFERNK